MLTITQLLQATWPTPIANSKNVFLKGIKVGVVRSSGFPKVLAIAYAPTLPDGKIKRHIENHKCSVTALGPKGFKGNVKVSCDCAYQTYYNEWALHLHGAADIQYSNGEPAVERNPQGKPNLCKHLYTLLRSIKSGKIV